MPFCFKNKVLIWGRSSGLQLRHCVDPTARVRVPGFKAPLCFWPSFLLKCTLGGGGPGLSSWVPAAHVEDLDQVPAAWPIPSFLGIREVKQEWKTCLSAIFKVNILVLDN